MQAQAAVFDLDGTLVDNMRFHVEAWVRYGASVGLQISEAMVERDFAGKRNDEIFRQLLGPSLSAAELERMAFEKEALYRELYSPHVREMPGLTAFLSRLKQHGVRCAVATSAPPANREWVLERLGLVASFEVVVGSESVARGKPFPDIFLAAAQALDASPGACVAFEDAVNGVRSAAAAGMKVAALTTMTQASALEDAGATWILSDYRALPADLSALLLDVARVEDRR